MFAHFCSFLVHFFFNFCKIAHFCVILRIFFHFLDFKGKFCILLTKMHLRKIPGKFQMVKNPQKKLVIFFDFFKKIFKMHSKILQILWKVQIWYFHWILGLGGQDTFFNPRKILSERILSTFFAHFLVHFLWIFFGSG